MRSKLAHAFRLPIILEFMPACCPHLLDPLPMPSFEQGYPVLKPVTAGLDGGALGLDG